LQALNLNRRCIILGREGPDSHAILTAFLEGMDMDIAIDAAIEGDAPLDVVVQHSRVLRIPKLIARC